MEPLVTFSSPAIMRSKVVLPQPLGPSRVTNSRFRMARSMSLTASWEPKDFDTFSSETSIRSRPSHLPCPWGGEGRASPTVIP